jgi:hypothetical protein
MAFGNILFGGFIGAGVDVATGAAYDYPNLLTVDLGTPGKPVASPQAQQAATTAGQAATAVEADKSAGTQRVER